MTRTKQLARRATFLAALIIFGAPSVSSAQEAEKPGFKLSGPPWLGVRMSDEATSGVRIAGVAHGSPAQKAGLAPGDIVTFIGAKPAKSAEHLAIMIRGRRAGDTLSVTVLRGESTKKIDVELEEMPSRTQVLSSHLVGRDAPSFRARLIAPDGGETRLEAFEGKPVVLEFWATWCGPCREMSQNLTALKREYGDRIHVVAVSAESERTIRNFVRKKGAPYVIARDLNRGAHDNYFIGTFPTVVLIDAEGKIAAVSLGNGEFGRFRKQVESLLEKP